MAACQACGREGPDWARFCIGCGAAVAGAPLAQASSVEREHITYLLAQIEGWRLRRLIDVTTSAMLIGEYRRRRDALDLVLLGARVPAPDDTGPVTAVVPSLDQRHVVDVPAPAAPVTSPTAPDSAGESWAPTPTSAVRTAAKDAPSALEFLELHWLKLLGALAGLFIIVGARQVAGWEFVSAIAAQLVPLVPFVLSVCLLRVGLRAGDQHAPGAYAANGAGIVVAAFVAGSVNKRWMNGALPSDLALAVGAACSVAVGALVLGRTRRAVYVHYIVGGALVTSMCALRAGLGWWDLDTNDPRAYAALLLVGTAILLAVGRVGTRPANSPSSAGDLGSIVLLWAHLNTAAIVAVLSLQALARGTTPVGNAALVGAAALVYGIAASYFVSAGMTYASGALAATGIVMALTGSGSVAGCYDYGAGFLVLALVGALMAAWARRVRAEAEDLGNAEASPAIAYGHIAAFASAFAGATVVGRAAEAAVGFGAPLSSGDWRRGVVVAGGCAVAYSVAAAWTRRPAVLYAAALALAYATSLAMHCTAPRTGLLFPHHAGIDLVPIAVLGLAGGFVLRRMQPTRTDDREWSAWWVPPMVASLAAATTGAARSLVGCADNTHAASGWLGLVSYGLMSVTGAAALLRAAPRGVAQWWTVLLAATTSAFAAFGAYNVAELRGWSTTTTAGAALLGSAWVWTAAACATDGRDRWHAVSSAARVGATLALVCGAVLLASSVRLDGTRQPFTDAVLLGGVLAFGGLLVARKDVDGSAFGSIVAVTALLWQPSVLGELTTRSIGAVAALATALAAASLLRAGWTSGRQWASATGASVAMAAAFAASACLAGDNHVHRAAALLPMIAAAYLAGCAASGDHTESFGRPLRLASSIVGIVAPSFLGGAQFVRPLTAIWQVDATLAAYGVALAAAALVRRSPNLAAGAALVLTAAPASDLDARGLHYPGWAAAMALVGAAWVICAWALDRLDAFRSIARVVFGAAAATTVVACTVGLANVSDGHGRFTILALAIGGAVGVALGVLRAAPAASHCGALSWFLAYALFIYDRAGVDAGVLDLYMIPVGLYLLAIGHLSGARGREAAAASYWWSGCLVVMSPTMVAFYTHYVEQGSPVHALILVAECLCAIGWGIFHRIKAFVFAGTIFALGFVSVLGAGAIKEVWTGLIALVVGLALLAAVYRLSLNREAAARWLERIGQEWKVWR